MSANEITDAEVVGLDPAQAIDVEDYEDPSPDEITDPNHPDYCEAAEGITPVEEEGDK